MEAIITFSATVELEERHIEMLISESEDSKVYVFEVEDEEELEMLIEDMSDYNVDFTL